MHNFGKNTLHIHVAVLADPDLYPGSENSKKREEGKNLLSCLSKWQQILQD
jgi:hypothetical protein